MKLGSSDLVNTQATKCIDYIQITTIKHNSINTPDFLQFHSYTAST